MFNTVIGLTFSQFSAKILWIKPVPNELFQRSNRVSENYHHRKKNIYIFSQRKSNNVELATLLNLNNILEWRSIFRVTRGFSVDYFCEKTQECSRLWSHHGKWVVIWFQLIYHDDTNRLIELELLIKSNVVWLMQIGINLQLLCLQTTPNKSLDYERVLCRISWHDFHLL